MILKDIFQNNEFQKGRRKDFVKAANPVFLLPLTNTEFVSICDVVA